MPRSVRPIRPYLEYQADRVEAVMAAHQTPARVTGGTVGPRLIRFILNLAPNIRYAKVRTLADDLALALQVPTLRIQRESEGVVLEFPNPNPQPVTLLRLLPKVQPLPPATMLLGLTDAGVPLLARLSAPEVAHILISGATGSGKSALLRTLVASLLLTHTPDDLRLLCIDPKGRTFKTLQGAPHLVRPVIRDLPEAVEALESLLRVMEVRDRRGETPGNGVPRIAVFMDELAELVMLGNRPITEGLTRLAQRGREAGIHLIAATQHPSAAILTGVMRANFPLRLVGKVVSPQDAQAAAGRGGTHAHLLNGHGDFLAVGASAEPIRFQVAYIEEKELYQHVTRMNPASNGGERWKNASL